MASSKFGSETNFWKLDVIELDVLPVWQAEVCAGAEYAAGV